MHAAEALSPREDFAIVDFSARQRAYDHAGAFISRLVDAGDRGRVSYYSRKSLRRHIGRAHAIF